MTEPKNAFLDMVTELENGGAVTELAQALTGLIADVQLHGRAGTLVLAIKATPKANSPQILISHDIKVTPPKPEREVTILYADKEHRLSRRDPRQPQLKGLAEVTPLRPAENVNTATGEVRE